MRTFTGLLSAAALYISTTSAALATHQANSNINYAVGVPSNTASSSSGSGDIYFQLSAPTSYSWVALGIGSEMAGSSIFVMYADGTGNVTISPRDGVGEVMPLYDDKAGGETTLLAGSGIAGGLMVANVKYSLPSGVLNTASTSAGWICAWKTGPALDSTSQSATIAQHDNGDHNIFTFDLTKAVLASDTNPFVAAAVPGSTSTGAGVSVPTVAPASGGSSSQSIGPSAADIKTFQEAHGIIMAGTMVVVLPIGAILMRVVGGVWLHAAVQLFGLAAIIVGFGLGIHLAQMRNELYNNAHTIFGTVIVGLFIIQPFLGLFHHRRYLTTGKPTTIGYTHMWYGRILIILAIVNGGLGLKLANNTPNGIIAYSVVSAVIFVAYAGTIIFTTLRPRSTPRSKETASD